MSNYFNELVEDFSNFGEVDGILLSGSKSSDFDDEHSDYDLYIYLNSHLDINTRKEITGKYCKYMEINNQFWETEDDGILKDGTYIDIIYRGLDWFDPALERTVLNCEASVGYTTCLWYNLLNSKILYDKEGKLKKLKDKYSIDYPDKLRENIIKKNMELLKDKIPSFYYQIEKAILRKDMVNITNRVNAFLESYFDIIFALNYEQHPGEKRLVNTALKKCKNLPVDFKENIDNLFHTMVENNTLLLEIVEKMIFNLKKIIV